ncbi:hypothetical protein [Nitrosomonas sp.]|uniref:hypothetical protein n=1 Tax=Nitrosomonas sp. TaxID=42353 RepID=UPI0025CF7128|nr:hypothetical protein [Nitrosomonas sp.]MBY0484872.1 hypothetical protein [Nitrosomonas sp.]
MIEQTLEFVTACVSWTRVYPARNFIGEKYAHGCIVLAGRYVLQRISGVAS